MSWSWMLPWLWCLALLVAALRYRTKWVRCENERAIAKRDLGTEYERRTLLMYEFADYKKMHEDWLPAPQAYDELWSQAEAMDTKRRMLQAQRVTAPRSDGGPAARVTRIKPRRTPPGPLGSA